MANILRVPFDSKDAWPIKNVTVYEDRSQITRILDYKSTDFGEVELKLENLPTCIMPESLRAEIETNNAVIFEVAHKENRVAPDPVEITERQKEIQKEIKKLGEETAALDKRLNWINQYSNKFVPTEMNTYKKGKELFESVINQENLDNLADSLMFYEKEVGTIDKRKIDINLEIENLQLESNRISNEAAAAQNIGTKVTKEATVLMNVPEEVSASGDIITVKLFYVVQRSSWKASYDVRVVKADEDVSISYYGKITNNTGEDWNEVQISLSTAKPSRPGNLPKLPRAIAKLRHFYEAADIQLDSKPMKPGGMFKRGMRKNKERFEDKAFDQASIMDMDDDSEGEEDLNAELEALVTADDTEAQDKGGSALFKLNRLCSIESDGKPHRQTVGTVKLEPSFTYVVSPKVSASCFLKCSAKNTSDYVLVEGPMAVFFNGSFVTISKMKSVNQNESFSVYLGIEDSVKIDYQPEISKTEVQKGGLITSGKTKFQTVSRTINIINTRDEDIDCVIYEQLPLARNEQIKVELLKPTLGKKDGRSYKLNKMNHLEGKKKVKKRSTWKVKFDFKVEWPKKQEIVFLESLENQA